MTDMTPFVSVIIATRDRRDMLEETIDSLEAQTYPRDRFEVVVVDNRSTDGTWDWLQSKARASSLSLRPVYNHDRPTDPGSGRNIGLALATGDVIAFTDSDCVVSPEWLEAGVSGFGDDVDVVIGKTLPHPGDPRPVLLKTAEVLTDDSFGDTCNILYNRRVFDAIGCFSDEFTVRFPYPKYYGDDVDLACRAREAGFKTAFGERALVYHHVRRQSVADWLLEPRKLYTCPYLVKKYPRTRRDFLFLHWFLTPMTAMFDLLLLGVVLAIAVSPWLLLLGAPFVVSKYREGGQHLAFPLRLARVLGSPVRATAVFATLALGSLRFRSLVL